MKTIQYLISASTCLACSTAPLTAAVTLLEDFQFEDTAGTTLPSVANDAGTASFSGAAANVATDNAGNLEFTVGADASDNVFRNAALTTQGATTGVYELAFSFSGSIAGGDATGANVGFGIRDDAATDVDLFIVRLHRQSSTLRLQTRIGNTNTNLENFGTTSVTNLTVRAVFNLDTDTMDVFWNNNGAGEQSSLGIAINDGELDMLRLASNTNTTDWGSSDVVDVGYLTLSSVPEPSSAALLGLGGLALILRRRK